MALKVVTDIERIGDHAVDIGRVAQRMSREALYKPLVDIPRMGDLARGMLHDALTAFVYHDIVLVEAVIAADDQIDALYARMRLDLQNIMQHDATAVIQASHLLFVGHYLERICDHCTNIAERIVYLETGRRPAPARSVGIVTTARNGSSPAANPAEAGSLDPSIDRVPA
jgi:phosphate transport system protein